MFSSFSIHRNEIFGLPKDWPGDWLGLNKIRAWNYLAKVNSSSFGQTGPYQVV